MRVWRFVTRALQLLLYIHPRDATVFNSYARARGYNCVLYRIERTVVHIAKVVNSFRSLKAPRRLHTAGADLVHSKVFKRKHKNLAWLGAQHYISCVLNILCCVYFASILLNVNKLDIYYCTVWHLISFQ